MRDGDDWLSSFALHFEWPVLHVALDFGFVEFTTDETFSVEYGIFGIVVIGVFSGGADPKTEISLTG